MEGSDPLAGEPLSLDQAQAIFWRCAPAQGGQGRFCSAHNGLLRATIQSMPAVQRSFRIRAYPNPAQQRMLSRWFGAARWLWNTALSIRSESYREFGWSFNGNDISRWLTQWKRT